VYSPNIINALAYRASHVGTRPAREGWEGSASYVWSSAVAVHEYVVQILGDGSRIVLILGIMRRSPDVAHAVLVLFAGIRAMGTKDERRSAKGRDVLNVLMGRKDDDPIPLDRPGMRSREVPLWTRMCRRIANTLKKHSKSD
jgi:hypothetical protein